MYIEGKYLEYEIKSLVKCPVPEWLEQHHISKERAYEILKRATGQDFGYDADKWKVWVDANRDRILRESEEKRKEELQRIRQHILSEKKLIFLEICSKVSYQQIQSLLNSMNLSDQTKEQIFKNYLLFTEENGDFEVYTPISVLKELSEQATSLD